MKPLGLALVACTMVLTACGSAGLTKEQQIQLAVAATLSQLPRPTAAPPPTPMPTPTAVALSGLFCEYQFCIGHPSEMALYDVSAAENQASPSTFSQGKLASYSSQIFIELLWQEAPGINDPQFMLDLITQSMGDTRSGSVEPKLVGPLNVFVVPITPTPGAATTLPFGVAAAWLCEGRAFAWKAYAPQQDIALSLMSDALARFRCEAH